MWVYISQKLVDSFKNRDVISSKDFSRKDLELIFRVTDEVIEKPERFKNCLKEKIIATLFFEKSTRTRDSFRTAIFRMGGKVIGWGEPSVSSVGKGESLRDTISMYDGYSDLIILRHSAAGAAKLASDVAEKPVINAGDGNREHPTQAILDLFTIKKVVGRLDSLTVGVLGDLKYGRTGSSLSYSLANYKDVKLVFIAPNILQMRPEVKFYLTQKNIGFKETANPYDVIKELDVLYVTRIQKERFVDKSEYEKVRGTYIVDRALIEKGKPELKVLHPLPRIDEIPTEVDELPHAAYIKDQAWNGPNVRQSLLSLVMGVYDGQ